MTTPDTRSLPDDADVSALLRSASLGERFVITPLPGGANNRVYRVEVDGQTALLKQYFRHPDDHRERCAAEWAFANYSWSRGIRLTPEPLACDAATGLALFEFLPGRKLLPREISSGHVVQAAALIELLNARPRPAHASTLPIASEACFSLREHVERIDVRVERVSQIEAQSDLDAAARRFAFAELTPVWHDCRANVLSADEAGASDELPSSSRILSPSDFGFHNALCDTEGRLRFFDFEYAGWDDPAKLVCDFFCQVQVPAAREFLPKFTAMVAALSDEPQLLHERVELLFPAYYVKWCCILLNEFTPAAAARRAFSSGDALPAETRKEHQLQKARAMLERLTRRA